MDMILNFMQSAAGYLVPFLTLTIVIVFIHEMGHFLTARYFGVTVEVFSIGFGPELLHWHDRYNTRWRIALIPLGGYVKFVGDADASSKPDPEAMVDSGAVTLNSRPLSQRAWIVAAGPLANFILQSFCWPARLILWGPNILSRASNPCCPINPPTKPV